MLCRILLHTERMAGSSEMRHPRVEIPVSVDLSDRSRAANRAAFLGKPEASWPCTWRDNEGVLAIVERYAYVVLASESLSYTHGVHPAGEVSVRPRERNVDTSHPVED